MRPQRPGEKPRHRRQWNEKSKTVSDQIPSKLTNYLPAESLATGFTADSSLSTLQLPVVGCLHRLCSMRRLSWLRGRGKDTGGEFRGDAWGWRCPIWRLPNDDGDMWSSLADRSISWEGSGGTKVGQVDRDGREKVAFCPGTERSDSSNFEGDGCWLLSKSVALPVMDSGGRSGLASACKLETSIDTRCACNLFSANRDRKSLSTNDIEDSCFWYDCCRCSSVDDESRAVVPWW